MPLVIIPSNRPVEAIQQEQREILGKIHNATRDLCVSLGQTQYSHVSDIQSLVRSLELSHAEEIDCLNRAAAKTTKRRRGMKAPTKS